MVGSSTAGNKRMNTGTVLCSAVSFFLVVASLTIVTSGTSDAPATAVQDQLNVVNASYFVEPPASSVPRSDLLLGTQAIYSPTWKEYNFTTMNPLTEQAHGIVRMGSNQLKLRLAPSTTCSGYRLDCGPHVNSLTSLSQVPAIAATFSDPHLFWYQIWLYSFSNPNFLKSNWTTAALQTEYQETKDWAVHMLQSHNGSGKVFMAGNWEGDWMLMMASGCQKGGKMKMDCDPSPEVIERMVQWGTTRQRAIDDAHTEAGHVDVRILYYMEMNLGPEALKGKPGVTNNVLAKVQPDLVSYSSYASTNAYATAMNPKAVDGNFHKVLDYVQSKLEKRELGLGFQKRVMIGEFGAHAKTSPTGIDQTRFVARVAHGALSWGCPFVLYWEFYDTLDTVPIIPASGEVTALYDFFELYLSEAKGYARENPSTAVAGITKWAVSWFANFV